MKKIYFDHFPSGKWKKTLTLMRLSIATLLCSIGTMVAAPTFSQQTRLDVSYKNESLRTVLSDLRQRTGNQLVFIAEEVSGNNQVTLTKKEATLQEILDAILPQNGLTYIVNDDVVIVTRIQQPQQAPRQVSGQVVDEQKNPVAGVVIQLKGTKIGTTTNAEGHYVLPFPKAEDAVLIFSFVGMKTQQIPVAGRNRIDVTLARVSVQVEDVVVYTGYERIDPRKTTSAIQTIKFESINTPGLQTIDQMLQGHVPGMIYMQNSGQVGTSPRLRIRGTSTILGSQEPVWVVDGVVQENPVNVDPSQINDLDFVNLLGNAISGLNPDDIEQIDILKDASATALYGARAANGVIVVTTKQGRVGAPALSYAFSGTFTRRPHYSDASVNMMNSLERVALSREMIEKRVIYPATSEWIGYEAAIHDYWNGTGTFAQMQQAVGRAESVNTDWFDLLMQNTFSTKHTLNLSGGTAATRYYMSLGINDSNGSIKGESLNSYTAALNLTTNYKMITARFGLTANTGRKAYTPGDVGVTKYAYETTRAMSPYNEDGSLWYYPRKEGNYYHDFNILEDKENTSQDIRSSQVSATASFDVKFTDHLKLSVTGSYSTSNTTQETWHGEKSFYATKLRDGAKIELPQGGELAYQNTERYSYTGRAQLNFNRSFGLDNKHTISATAGGEVSSTEYFGLNQVYRGYLKERGKKMAAIVLDNYPDYATWKQSNSSALGEWTSKLTNIVSGYATASYTYDNRYTVNANVRIDASNRFGSRANEKPAPIWSLSARWNIKEDILRRVSWVSNLSLLGSFGYQGNMLETQSAQLVIARQGMKDYFDQYYSTVKTYPNPDLKWEKTSSYNGTLNFELFRGHISGSASYYYKKTQNAFVPKTITSVMGVSDWVVNDGVIENQGMELSLRFNVIDTRRHNPNGIRWSVQPNFGSVLNKVSGKNRDKSLASDVTYGGFLDGTIVVEGRPLNSFYSYHYYCLDATNGLPIFKGSSRYLYENGQTVDLLAKYQNMTLSEVCNDVMVYSGTRVPKFQGGLQNSILWRRFSLGVNLACSFGNKIRLLQMYPSVDESSSSIAAKPMYNVRREFINRWQNPGDELKTNVPAVVSSTEFKTTVSTTMWWYGQANANDESIGFARNLWTMYDKSDLRVVNGNYIKIQSASLRYNIPDNFCKRIGLNNAYVGFSGTNLYTFCSKKLKGQDPATQDGTQPTLSTALTPTYSFNLNLTF